MYKLRVHEELDMFMQDNYFYKLFYLTNKIQHRW